VKKVAHIAGVFVLAASFVAFLTAEAEAQSADGGDTADSRDTDTRRTPGTDVALARRLFEQGIEFVDQEDWDQAADRFQRSLILRPSPIVAYNLGSALVELERLVEASEAFRHAIHAAGTPPELSDAARESLAEIEGRIAILTVEVRGDLDGVQFFVGDRPLPPEAIGVGAPIDPGSRNVRAVRDGSEIASAQVEIAEGGHESVTLDLPAREVLAESLLAGGPGSAADDEGGGVLSSPWFWVGVGAVVAGAVALILALTLGGQSDTDPVPGNLTPGVVEF